MTADKGWLSHRTYEDLPERFQVIARELEAAGEIEIERSNRMNQGQHGAAVFG